MTNIYFISDGHYIKIGKSKDLKKRSKQLQTGNGNNLRLLYRLENVEDYFEKEIHNICKVFKIQGEWFEKEVLEFLMKLPWFKENLKRY